MSETKQTTETTETITINPNQLVNIRAKSKGNWKESIIQYLRQHNGSSDIQLYDATRADRRDIPDTKKVHNIASQLTYLRDDGYIIIKEENRINLLAVPTKTKGQYEVMPGQKAKLDSLLK